MTLAPGARLGPYEITAHIGSGGMGDVYRAHDTRLGRDVAVKVLPSNVSTDRDRLSPGVVLGTLGYMAPEQVRGQQSDRRADMLKPQKVCLPV